MVAAGFIMVIGVFGVVWAVGVYNNLVGLSLRAEGAWSDIDVQLKRRYELIPNLVSSVKGYAVHENQLFQQVAEIRSRAEQAVGPKEKGNVESALSGSVKNLFAVAENYPKLRASENFLSLQKNLSEIENTIQSARRYYNAVVRDYNTKLGVFPDLIIGRLSGFHPKDFFQLDSAEQARNPKVSL